MTYSTLLVIARQARFNRVFSTSPADFAGLAEWQNMAVKWLAHTANDTVRFTSFVVYNGDRICLNKSILSC